MDGSDNRFLWLEEEDLEFEEQVGDAFPEFEEQEHPRGQPFNRGQFREKSEGEKGARPEDIFFSHSVAGMIRVDDVKKYLKLKQEYAEINDALERYIDAPESAIAKSKMQQLLENVKQMRTLRADPGTIAGLKLPGGPKDVLIVGAGPGGLQAGIAAGYEGLETMIVEAQSVAGGQAKHSARIENLGGWPLGVAGERLSRELLKQAERYGSDIHLNTRVTGISFDPSSKLKTVTLSNGDRVEARSVILAGGVEFRQPHFPGAGNATEKEGIYVANGAGLARANVGKPVLVIGGGNGAAQAALGCAKTCSRVYLLAKDKVVSNMSEQMVNRLRANSKVTLIEGDEIAELKRDEKGNPASFVTKNGVEGPCSGAGVFIGSLPKTEWLPEQIKRNKFGHVEVDNNLMTGMPGVYAIGDQAARAAGRSIGRVGAAMGDAHQVLKNLFSYFQNEMGWVDPDAPPPKPKAKDAFDAELPPLPPDDGILDAMWELDARYPYLGQCIEAEEVYVEDWDHEHEEEAEEVEDAYGRRYVRAYGEAPGPGASEQEWIEFLNELEGAEYYHWLRQFEMMGFDAKMFEEEKHARRSKGDPRGGQFAPKAINEDVRYQASQLKKHPLDLMKDEVGDALKWEYEREYLRYGQGAMPGAFRDWADFEQRYHATPMTYLTNDEYDNLEYTSINMERLPTMKEVRRFIGGRRDVDRIRNTMLEGITTPPIVMRRGERLRLLGGQTRIFVGFANGIRLPVKVIDVTEKVSRKKKSADAWPKFDELKIKRHPKGDPKGGQFAPKGDKVEDRDGILINMDQVGFEEQVAETEYSKLVAEKGHGVSGKVHVRVRAKHDNATIGYVEQGSDVSVGYYGSSIHEVKNLEDKDFAFVVAAIEARHQMYLAQLPEHKPPAAEESNKTKGAFFAGSKINSQKDFQMWVAGAGDVTLYATSGHGHNGEVHVKVTSFNGKTMGWVDYDENEDSYHAYGLGRSAHFDNVDNAVNYLVKLHTGEGFVSSGGTVGPKIKNYGGIEIDISPETDNVVKQVGQTLHTELYSMPSHGKNGYLDVMVAKKGDKTKAPIGYVIETTFGFTAKTNVGTSEWKSLTAAIASVIQHDQYSSESKPAPTTLPQAEKVGKHPFEVPKYAQAAGSPFKWRQKLKDYLDKPATKGLGYRNRIKGLIFEGEYYASLGQAALPDVIKAKLMHKVAGSFDAQANFMAIKGAPKSQVEALKKKATEMRAQLTATGFPPDKLALPPDQSIYTLTKAPSQPVIKAAEPAPADMFTSYAPLPTKGIDPVPAGGGGVINSSAWAITPVDLEKAKNNKNFYHPQQHNNTHIYDLVSAFNAKYTGKTLTEQKELEQKVVDFKDMQKKILTITAQMEKETAEKAKAEAAKEAEKYNDPEVAKHYAVLAAILGNSKDAQGLLKNAESRVKYAKLEGVLTPAEAAQIIAYSGSHYGPVNRQLREGTITPQQYKYAKSLDKALRKMPPYEGTVYRKTDLPAEVAKKYKEGNIVVERSFTSSSTSPHVWSGAYRYVINSKTGREISRLSSHGSEKEVLFTMNSDFKVTKVVGKEIHMEEIIDEHDDL